MKCEIKDCEFHRYSHVYFIRHKDFPEILSWPEVEKTRKNAMENGVDLPMKLFQAVPSQLYIHSMTKDSLIHAYAWQKTIRKNNQDFGLKKMVKR